MFARQLVNAVLALLVISLAGCRGGEGGDPEQPAPGPDIVPSTPVTPGEPTPTQPVTGANLEPPTVSITATRPKLLTLSWKDVSADHYKLRKSADDKSSFSQVGANIENKKLSVDESVAVHLQDWINVRYVVQACDAADVCVDSKPVLATAAMIGAIGYFKASNTGARDGFGWSVVLSSDGNTLAVGAPAEASSAMGVAGKEADDSAPDAGAVYVFAREDNSWKQQAYVKASNTEARDNFGWAIALSADGNTLAVGAFLEDSNATGINGKQDDNSARGAGAVYVYARAEKKWKQQAYIKASNAEAGDGFGYAVALSADGNTLAASAYLEDSNATGVGGNQADNSADGAGAVYIFTRAIDVWTQQSYVKASNTSAFDYFGERVALAGDGNTLAVAAIGEDSNATGIDGNAADNSALDAGAVYVYLRSGNTWIQQAYVKASNAQTAGSFGGALALSVDGDTLAVGSRYESHAVKNSVDPTQPDQLLRNAGAVYVYARTGRNWTEQAYVKASNNDADDLFGAAVALSSDGNILAVGATGEDSRASGIVGNQAADNSVTESGAVYVYTRTDAVWTQRSYVKSSNTGADDFFGGAVSLSADGNTLVVGADTESSNAMGVGGKQIDESAPAAGAVYMY